MAQSHTLSVGMDGHKESIAVASVAQDYGAAVISRALSGPGSVIVTSSFGRCSRKARSASASTKPAPAAPGSRAP